MTQQREAKWVAIHLRNLSRLTPMLSLVIPEKDQLYIFCASSISATEGDVKIVKINNLLTLESIERDTIHGCFYPQSSKAVVKKDKVYFPLINGKEVIEITFAQTGTYETVFKVRIIKDKSLEKTQKKCNIF